ncbi:hypothetical protein Bca4012_072078 [Brassica carinata]
MYYNYSLRTCRNVELSRRGYNDNVLFHRIIKVEIVLELEEVGNQFMGIFSL